MPVVASFEAFGVHLNIGYLLVGYVVAYSVGTLAPTPGGLGAMKGIMIALYVSFGVPSAVAVAVVLVYRDMNFWLPRSRPVSSPYAMRCGQAAGPSPKARWKKAAERLRKNWSSWSAPVSRPATAAGGGPPRRRSGPRRQTVETQHRPAFAGSGRNSLTRSAFSPSWS